MTCHLIVLLAALLLATPAAAQSLVEVAKKEEARRNAVSKPSQVYTNANLTPNPQSKGDDSPVAPPLAPGGTPGNPAAGTAKADGAVAQEPAKKAQQEEKLDEEWWRGRAASLKARIEKAREAVAAVSMPATGDEREQAMIAGLLKRAQEVLDRAERDYELFQQQADATKVPKSWVQ